MTFLDERLKAHVGGLIRLKTDLYWRNTNSWDGVKGRICLLLAFPTSALVLDAVATLQGGPPDLRRSVAVLLLIDGSPKFVSITERTVEFIE